MGGPGLGAAGVSMNSKSEEASDLVVDILASRYSAAMEAGATWQQLRNAVAYGEFAVGGTLAPELGLGNSTTRTRMDVVRSSQRSTQHHQRV